jgi:hypothetical protein
MTYVPKPNTFTLFVNEKKSNNSPDMTGTFIDASGKEMRIAAWKKEGKNGEFYSGQISEKISKDKTNLSF